MLLHVPYLRNHIQIMGQLSYTSLGISFRAETHSLHSYPTLRLYNVFRYTNVERRKVKKESGRRSRFNMAHWFMGGFSYKVF